MAENPLSSLSYTNKDFRDIYSELLDLVKKLTYKWDPSISNESDPGVILLKLNAIIGDKNNYNIDKNILEVFPETLTQDVSARTMYHQLAYNMPWYRSGTTTLTFKWTGPDIPSGSQVVIPRFTMVTDSDSKTIFTVTQDVYFDSQTLTSTATAIQGIITDVNVNGETELHLVNLDHNNRLYLDDYAVAENGIFVSNATEKISWKRVDNLSVEPLGNTYYEFGIDTRSNTCYIEFPDDIESLIRSGLSVKYVISEGRNGNVASKIITKFYDDITVKVGDEDVNLNSDSCVIYNTDAVTNGDDPQSITDAYKSYKKVAGTFDTLVTLRDYINAVYQMDNVSNAVVSDRNTDIQSSYSVLTDGYSAFSHKTYVEKDAATKSPELNAFDLKLYMLYNPGMISTIDDYEKSFEMISSNSEDAQIVKLNLEQKKCVCHDFKDISSGTPCLFRIAFPLRIKIVPQYYLTTMQQDDVKRNVIKELFNTLNASKVEFGEEPNYDKIYDAIENADDRIKVVILDDFQYTVYATFWEGNKFKNIPISTFDKDPYIVYTESEDPEAYFKQKMSQVSDPERYYYVCKDTSMGIKETAKYLVYRCDNKTDKPKLYSSNIDEFRRQIIAKSILSGVTPLFKAENTFECTLDQQQVCLDRQVDRISTDLTISPFGIKKDSLEPLTISEIGDRNTASYKLKDNESIQFLAPSFISKRNFSNYVAYQFIKNEASTETDYISISQSEYENISNSTHIYVFSDDILKYVDITSQKIKLTDSYITPIYNPETYYNESGELVTKLEPPEDWGEGNYYRSSVTEVSNKIEFTKKYGLTYKSAWESRLIDLYIKTPVYRIPSDTDYKLQKGDSLTLFYTEEQETNSPYTYECYKYIAPEDETETVKCPVIRPSFTLNGTDKSSAIINPDVLLDTGYIPYSNAPTSSYQKIYELFGYNALSGSQSIDIRGMNEKYIKKTEYYYYFITNNIIQDDETKDYYYSLELSKYKETNHYQYTLQTNEYFIYTNKSKTEFEILGPGTLIRFLDLDSDQKSQLLQVPKIDYSDIARYGISSFEKQCQLFKNNAILREQQLYNFTSGDIISITLDEEKYEDTDKCPAFRTTEETPVENFTISYSSDGSIFKSLPGIDIKDEDAIWKGRAILNINSSYDDPQVIDNYVENDETRQSIQRITIHEKTYPKENDIKDGCLMYMLTDVSMTQTGGKNIDVTYLGIDGQTKNLQVLLYTLNPDFSKAPFDRMDDNIIASTTIKQNKITVDNIDLEQGYDYILGVSNSSSKSGFNIEMLKGSESVIECLNPPKDMSESFYFDSSRTWYFKITGDTGLTMTLLLDNSDPNGVIVFEPLLKCLPNTAFENKYGITHKQILDKINSYEGASEFKYNHIVDPDTQIEDPLEGSSFFKENHIFNKYAISYAQLRMSNVSELDSNISIVNNR